MFVQKKERLWKIGLHFFFVVIICISALWGIRRNTTITVISDEYAYWLPAAWLNGRDWSASSMLFSYYGYGYGCFVLSIIMKLFQNVRLMYQMALVVNTAMLVCNYFLSYKCWLKLVNTNNLQGAVAAFAVTVYSSNILYAKMTLVEVFLSFLFWILVYLSISIQYNRIKKVFFCMTLMLLLASHNRGLGIVAAFIVSIVICGKQKDGWRERIELFLYLILGFILWYVCKNYFEGVLYTNTPASTLAANNMEGQVSKIKTLLNVNGLHMILTSFLGKTFYILVSSFFIAGYGLIYLGKKILLFIKQRKCVDMFSYLFVGLSFLALLSITVIVFAYYQGRADLLMYGRYHESFMGPILLFGIAEIVSQKNSIKETLCLVFIGILLCLFVARHGLYNESTTNLGINCVGISDLCYKYGFNINLIYTALLRGIFLCVIMCILKNRRKYRNLIIYCWLAVVSAFWINISLYDASERLYSWTENTLETNITFLDEVEKKEDNLTTLYMFHMEDNSGILYLQFLRPDAEIVYLTDKEELGELESGTVVISGSNRETSGDIFADAQYTFVASNYFFSAWEKRN